MVQIDDTLFHLTSNQHAVPAINLITTSIAADANLQMMDPFTAADAHTEEVKTCKIVPIPHFITDLWLTEPDGIIACYFWDTIYPVIEGTG